MPTALSSMQHQALLRCQRYGDLLPRTVAEDVASAIRAYEAAVQREQAEAAIVQRVGVQQKLGDGERE